MCSPTLILMSAAAGMGAYAKQKQGEYTNDVAKYNARQMENEATRTRNKGLESEQIQREKTAQLKSRQRAQLGASGVDLEAGSALALQEDTDTLGEADALRIRTAYQDKAQVLDDQSTLTLAQGEAAEDAGNMGAFTSLLGGGAQVAGKWYQPGSSAGQGASDA